MSGANRRYLLVGPLAGPRAKTIEIEYGRALGQSLPPRITPLAVLYRDSTYVPDGIMVRTPAGVLAHWTGSSFRPIDQRKANAALDHLAREAAKDADRN